MRLIDAEKVKRKIKYIARAYGVSESVRNKLLNAVDDSVVNAEPVRYGEWLYSDIYLPNCAECSGCGWKSSVSGDEISGYHFCPNCGAKMDGGENGS